jgi:hypothetical protein
MPTWYTPPPPLLKNTRSPGFAEARLMCFVALYCARDVRGSFLPAFLYT